MIENCLGFRNDVYRTVVVVVIGLLRWLMEFVEKNLILYKAVRKNESLCGYVILYLSR
jgi:hypothetical protein